jgi:hypothetical protein
MIKPTAPVIAIGFGIHGLRINNFEPFKVSWIYFRQ